MNIQGLATLLGDAWIVEVEAESACISVENDDGLVAFAYVGESQILIETILFPLNAVADVAKLNADILQTHHLIPLSSICVRPIDGKQYYVAFGALSASSKAEVIIEEVEALFSNVSEFLELYEEHLVVEA